VSLYYRDDDEVQIAIAVIEFLNENTGSPISLLDVPVMSPVVGPGDPWACRGIGIRIRSAVGLEETHLQGGTWGIDDVRLEARESEAAPADFDFDGGVDLRDYDYFRPCMTGPDHSVTCCNRRSDIDGDGDADLLDYSLLSAAFTEG
jgi:hypothetical protein